MKKRTVLAKYGDKARTVLDALLQNYADTGIKSVESLEILKVDPLTAFGTPVEIVSLFGGKPGYLAAIRELETALYENAALRKDTGTCGDAERLEQLGWMFFLKIFDDREKELEVLRDSCKSPLPQHLRWCNWATDAGGITGDALLDFVNNQPPPRLKALTGGADKIAGLIRMAFEDANNCRAGLVLPGGTLFGEGVKTRIKEALPTECNLHTIVRLPNGVFNPYTGIRTNLLFFTKGAPTTAVWYYEHPYPAGAKSYNKGKPIRIEEFDEEKAWWGTEADGFAARVENERAWRVPIAQIEVGNFNLDLKNPHNPDTGPGDVDHLLPEYEKVLAQIAETRGQLKAQLMEALTR